VILAEDVSALQTDLSNLVAWSKEWQMRFGVEKCKVMHIGHNNVQPGYVMNDVTVCVMVFICGLYSHLGSVLMLSVCRSVEIRQ